MNADFETLLIHAGNAETWPEQLPTAPPLITSTSYRARAPEIMDAILGGEQPGYTYSRHANPTVEALERAVMTLEGGEAAVAYASGMAALDAAWHAVGVKPGDHVVLSRDLYGATLNLTETFWAQWGVVTHLVDVTDLHAIDQALRSWHPKAMLLETLSNPLLKVPDIPEIVRLSQGFDCRVIVDNTFATPYLFRPIAHGADVVVHSATKYLGGHGDAMGGIVVVRERAAAEALHQFVKLRGAVLGPFEAWLLHRGIKTLAVRIRQQCDNAHHVAQALAQSGAFERVVYPGLPDHPSHQMAKRLFGDRGAGAVVTVDMAGGRAAVFRFLKRLTWVTSATTVGDVYTLCLYPKISSHRNQSPALLDEMGIHDGTVRIAVGLESWRDIVNDVLQAVKA